MMARHYFDSLHKALSEQYQTCDCSACKKVRLNLADDPKTKQSFKELLKIAETAFKKLFEKGKYKPEDLFAVPEYQDLAKGTAELFSSAIPQETPQEMQTYLEQDAFIFSELKAHAELTEARSYLKDEKGNVIPYHEFEQKVLKLNKKYNKNYLEAEYEFAVHSAQSAANWANLQENTDRYWLEYRTAGDERVRQEHEALRGTCLPKNDPFWQDYYPPNGWRCRCVAVEVLAREKEKSNSKDAIKKGRAATSKIGKNGKNRLAMFRFNPGLQKKMFPPKNSYNKVVGTDIILSIITSPIVRKYKNGGVIKQSNLVDAEANDYDRVYNFCNHHAKIGHETEIMPIVHRDSEMYQTYYKPLVGTKYEGKCPDIKLDGKFYEHEGFQTKYPKKALKNMLNRGLKQSDRVVIDDCGVTDRYLFNNIQARIKQGQDITEVWVMKGKDVRLVYKKTEAN